MVKNSNPTKKDIKKDEKGPPKPVAKQSVLSLAKPNDPK